MQARVVAQDDDGQIKDIEEEISKILDKTTLKEELERQLGRLDYNTLDQLQIRDREITQELMKLKDVWVVVTLIKEIEVNLELYELETVSMSLKSLKERQNANIFSTNKMLSDHLQSECSRLFDEFIDKLQYAWNKLLVISSESVQFNKETIIDGNSISYNQLVEIFSQEPTLQLLVKHVNLSHVIDQKVLSPLIEKRAILQLNSNGIDLIENKNPSLSNIIKSIENLSKFITLFPESPHIINYIYPRLSEWMKEIITVNIDNIYRNQDDLRSQFIQLGKILNDNGFTRNSIHEWIYNELDDIAIEEFVNVHIEKIRELIRNLTKKDFIQLVERSTKTDTPQIKDSEVKNIATKGGEDDDWGWADEDVEFPEVQSPEDKKSDDEWDWNEDDNRKGSDDDKDWDWNDEEEENIVKPQKKLVSRFAKKARVASSSPMPNRSLTYQSTKIPHNVFLIFKSYLSTSSRIEAKSQQSHFAKLNYLATSFFILATQRYPTSSTPLLLFNDVCYLNSLLEIPRLRELNDEYLLELVRKYEVSIKDEYAKLGGLDPSLNTVQTFKIVDSIQVIFDDLYENLSILSSDNSLKIIITIIGEFYQMIIRSIFSKADIGEDESNYLNSIITKFLEIKTPIDSKDLSKLVKNHSRLMHINFILNSHLKDIMNGFYNAEFFDLSTQELVSLIDKLFADSDLKRSSIQEIQEIRESE